MALKKKRLKKGEDKMNKNRRNFVKLIAASPLGLLIPKSLKAEIPKQKDNAASPLGLLTPKPIQKTNEDSDIYIKPKSEKLIPDECFGKTGYICLSPWKINSNYDIKTIQKVKIVGYHIRIDKELYVATETRPELIRERRTTEFRVLFLNKEKMEEIQDYRYSCQDYRYSCQENEIYTKFRELLYEELMKSSKLGRKKVYLINNVDRYYSLLKERESIESGFKPGVDGIVYNVDRMMD